MKLNDSEITGVQPEKATLEHKCFTLAEANSALPLVRRIVQDLVDQYSIVMDLHDQVQEQSDTLPEEKLEEMESARLAATTRLNDLVSELSDIGCELKDWESGQVDFPAKRDGWHVYLCWELGEEEIGFWHEIEAGPAARKPVTEQDNL